MNKEEIVQDNDCPSCGSNLKYNAKTKSWLCEYCNVNYTLEDLKKFNNASSEKNNEDINQNNNYTVYRCDNCGAEIICDKQEAATFCIYCRSTAILKSKLSGEFKPKYIIPFKVPMEKVQEEFKNLTKGRPLIPKTFLDPNNIKSIKGVYIPFWLHDISTSGEILYEATSSNSWTSGDYRYTETKTYDCYRNAEFFYKKIPTDGSTRFPNDIMNSIEPFDYNDLEDYNHAYLSGFYAEKYDVNNNDAYKESEKRANNTSHIKYKASVNKGIKRIKKDNLQTTLHETNYVLLPVYMVNIIYKNKPYTFAMNGQTGKFIGNIPVDQKKRFLMFLAIFFGSAFILNLIAFLVYLGGRL